MSDSPEPNDMFRQEAQAYYAEGIEADRLQHGSGRIEFARTQEIVSRYLPPPPAVVFDIGGGPGVYATLARPTRLRSASHRSGAAPYRAGTGRRPRDSRTHRLPVAPSVTRDTSTEPTRAWTRRSCFGPLYHLTEREDRVTALREAARIVRPGGVVLAVGISRFVSTLDGHGERLPRRSHLCAYRAG